MKKMVFVLCVWAVALWADRGDCAPTSWELYVLNHNGEILSTHRLAQKVSLQFQTCERFSGSSGCNNFFGSYERGDSAMSLLNVGVTRKMCDPKSMQIESLLLTLFRDGKLPYTLQDDELILERDSLKAVFKKTR